MVRFRVSQSQGQRDTVRQTASCATRISGAYYTIQQRRNLGRATRNASSVDLNGAALQYDLTIYYSLDPGTLKFAGGTPAVSVTTCNFYYCLRHLSH